MSLNLESDNSKEAIKEPKKILHDTRGLVELGAGIVASEAIDEIATKALKKDWAGDVVNVVAGFGGSYAFKEQKDLQSISQGILLGGVKSLVKKGIDVVKKMIKKD